MRLLTYNIHKGIGGRDRRYRLARVLDIIESANPDLVCLQEVTRGAPRSRRENQPSLLARHFRFDKLYQMNVHYKVGGYGNLILSRWPFRTTHQISLRYRERKPRGAQLTVIDTPEGSLHLINWHLGLSDRERRWQAEHLLEHRLYRESVDLPTLLVGDTNDWRDRLIHGPLGEAGFRHETRPPSRFRTFPAWLPVGSLDKVSSRGDIQVRHAHVVHSALARRASDHLPVVVDFHHEASKGGAR
jgi:endonuclease/exonuclease/phosphatase family metal-dependent hydrolase